MEINKIRNPSLKPLKIRVGRTLTNPELFKAETINYDFPSQFSKSEFEALGLLISRLSDMKVLIPIECVEYKQEKVIHRSEAKTLEEVLRRM